MAKKSPSNKPQRAVGVTEFLAKKFETYEFDGPWKESFGSPERNFSALIYGPSGHGKTEFCMKFAKYLTRFGKVYFNTFEQGLSESLQTALIRNNMQEVAGLITFGNRETYAEMWERLERRNSAQIVFIDSRDYMELEHTEFKALINRFPKKAFVITAWEKNGRPKGDHAQAILYMVDMKLQVKDFRVLPRSRFGGEKPFVIWDKKTTSTQPKQAKLDL